MDDWDSEEKGQSEPEPLKVTTEKDSGVMLLDFLQQVHNYFTAYPTLIIQEFSYKFDKRELFLSDFELAISPPGVWGNIGTANEWTITLVINEAMRCWRQFPEVAVSRTIRPSVLRGVFGRENGMNPLEVMNRLDEGMQKGPDPIKQETALLETWSAVNTPRGRGA
jgi:hypothetical protein